MIRYLTVLVFLVVFGQANAGPLNITDIVGGWQNPLPVGTAITNVANQGTDTIRWGTTSGQQSGYNFTPGADVAPVVVDTAFLLGNFQHINQPIGAPVLSSVDYSFGFSTNGVPGALSTVFGFAHDETPNDGTCDGGVDGPSVTNCDDFVTVTSLLLNQIITVGSDTYFFNLLGFSKDGGTTFNSQFQSGERATNSAGLYGIITRQAVPEPGTLGLLGLGLLGVGLMQRRRREV